MDKVGVVEIAREAGVSIATVSRVLNDSPRVAPKTRKRVLRVIQRRDYRPNVAASDLRRGKSRTIGLAVASISQPWYVKLIRAIRHAISEHGYTTIVYDLEHSDDVLIEQVDSVRTLQLAGMILATGDRLDSEPVRTSLEKLVRSVPLVVIGQPLDGADWTTLHFDDAGASETATRELLLRRPKPLLFLGSSPRSFLAAERMKGVKKVLRDFPELRTQSRFLRLSRAMDYAEGYEKIRRHHADLSNFGTLFCANDELALGACRAAQEFGIRVPEDLMVLGYGDIDVLPYVTPTLSSVSGDADIVAADALEAIIARIEGKDFDPERVYDRRVVHRESTTIRQGHPESNASTS